MKRFGFVGALCAAALWAATVGAQETAVGKTLKVTFRNQDGQEDSTTQQDFGSETFNVLTGTNTAGRFASVKASALKLTDGSAAPWSLACSSNAKVAGAGAALLTSDFTSEQQAEVAKVFPMAAVTGTSDTAQPNLGSPLQCDSGTLSVTFGGVEPLTRYSVTVLAGRGNAWGEAATYSVSGGTVLEAQVLASSTGNTPTVTAEQGITADTNDGKWALMTFDVVAAGETLTLEASAYAGNIKALALTCIGPTDMAWIAASDGTWTDETKWRNYSNESGTTAYLREVADASSIRIEAAGAAVGTVNCLASDTAYTLAELPETVAVQSTGRLTLADADATYGHAVSGGPIYVIGETVTLTRSPEVPVYVLPGSAPASGLQTLSGTESTAVPGQVILAEGVTVPSMTLGEACSVAGSGAVETLTVEAGAAVDVSQGTLRVGSVTAPQPTLHETSLPVNTSLPEPDPVVLTLEGSPADASAPLLQVTGSSDGVVFQVSADNGSAVTVEPDADGNLTLPEEGPVNPTVTFSVAQKTDANGGNISYAGVVTAKLTYGTGSTLTATLPDGGVTAATALDADHVVLWNQNGQKFHDALDPGINCFYHNTATAAGLSDFLTVNCQLTASPATFWQVDLPFELSGTDAAELFSAYPRVLPSLFVCTKAGAPQIAENDRALTYTLSVVDGADPSLVYLATAPVSTGDLATGLLTYNEKSGRLGTVTAGLTAAQSVRIRLRVSGGGDGTFAGVRSLTFEPAVGESLSLNFEGGRDSVTYPMPDDATLYGVEPVAGSNWNDLADASGTLTSLKDGSGTAGSAAVTWSAPGTWAVDSPDAAENPYAPELKGFLGDGQPISVTVTGIPYTAYTAYVYYATNTANAQFLPAEVNGVTYTAGTDDGAAVPGSAPFGDTDARTSAVNTNVLKIEGLSGDLTVVGQTSNNGSGNRGSIAAIQIVNAGEVIVSQTIDASGATGEVLLSDYADSLGASKAVTLTLGTGVTGLTVDTDAFHTLTVTSAVAVPVTVTAAGAAARCDFSGLADGSTLALNAAADTIGALTFDGNVAVGGNLTLQVGHDCLSRTSYWTLGGTLTVDTGASLTVAVADGVTPPNPYALIQTAGTDLPTVTLADDANAAVYKLTPVGGTLWLSGSGTLRATVSGTSAWSGLTWTDNAGNGVTSPVFSDTTQAVLTFEGEAATLTMDASATVGALSLKGIGSIVNGDGSLTVTGTVTAGQGAEVTLPVGVCFSATASNVDVSLTAFRTPDVTVSAGATVTVDIAAGSTVYRRGCITGGGTFAVTGGGTAVIRGVNVTDAVFDRVTVSRDGGILRLDKLSANGRTPILRDCEIRLAGGAELNVATNSEVAGSVTLCPLPEGDAARLTLNANVSLSGSSLTVAGDDALGAATLQLGGSGQIARLPTTVQVEAPAVFAVPCATTTAATIDLGRFRGTGVLEIAKGAEGAKVSGFGMSAGVYEGTLRIADGVTKTQSSGSWTIPCNVELNGYSGNLTVGSAYTLSGTGTVTGTLTFVGGATLDASAGALTVGGLTRSGTGTVTVKVAWDAQPGTPVLKLSSGTADSALAAKFTVAERDTLRVAASGSDYVLATRMPTDVEASVTVTKPADGSSVKWSGLQWTAGGIDYPSAAAGATNALTLALPEGVTMTVDETIAAKSLTVTVVDGNGDGQVTEPATLLLRGDEDLAGIAETLIVTAPAVLQVPCTGTAQQVETMDLSKVRGSGVLEISGAEGATCSALGLSTEAGKTFEGTLRIAAGVIYSGGWTIPCDVELNGTVSGTLTVPTGKRFGGSGIVTGQLDLANGYILKCGASAEEVPLIEGGLLIHSGTAISGGRLWRDTAKADYILRLSNGATDNERALVADSSGYVVDKFTEDAVSGLRLAAAFELDLRNLSDESSGTYAWDVAGNWLAPGGGNSVPGTNDVVRIMVPASRNVTVVIPPNITAAVRAIQVIGMTGEAAGWTPGTLRWVEGKMPSGSEDVPSPTELTSTLTAREIRMAGPMEITQECNVSVQYEDYWSEGAHIGSGAAHCSVWIKAGAFNTYLLLVANTDLRVGGGSLKASVICDSLNLQTQSGGTGLLKIDQNGDFTPSYIHGISKQDSLELAGGTFTVPVDGMELSDQIVVSADSTLHFAGTDPTEAILSFAADAPKTGFSGSGTLTLTGTGTLDASNATEGSVYTGHLQFPAGNQVVCNIGQRRPAIGGAPYRIEVVPKTEETDEVRIPLNEAANFVMPPLSDADATAGVAVSGWVGTVAEIVKTETSSELVLTPLGYPTLDGANAPGISGEAAMVLRKLANSINSNFTVRQTTVTGDSMDFDAEGVNAALLIFTNVAKKEADGSVTVAYAFGIDGITVNGNAVVVKAKVLGPEGVAAEYKEGTYVNLYRIDADNLTAVASLPISSGVIQENGNVELTDGDALSGITGDGVLKFKVKAEDKAVDIESGTEIGSEGDDFTGEW